ncbi:MAG: hypothetical protein Q4G62_05085 [Pseudomonadota bacterium]|nr:hypothetical protein [Pseudomonadota bacterium]
MKHTSIAIALFSALLCGQVAAQGAKPIPTRYGNLTSGSDGQLHFKGRAIQSPILYEGSAANQPLARFAIGTSDVILFQQAQGRLCPGNFSFVTVTARGARASRYFGSCHGDYEEPVQSGDTVIFAMPGAEGRGTVTFIWKDGAVLRDGKPLESTANEGRPWTPSY